MVVAVAWLFCQAAECFQAKDRPIGRTRHMSTSSAQKCDHLSGSSSVQTRRALADLGLLCQGLRTSPTMTCLLSRQSWRLTPTSSPSWSNPSRYPPPPFPWTSPRLLIHSPTVQPLRVVQPGAVCEVGGSTPDLSYGDLGISLGGGQTEEFVH